MNVLILGTDKRDCSVLCKRFGSNEEVETILMHHSTRLLDKVLEELKPYMIVMDWEGLGFRALAIIFKTLPDTCVLLWNQNLPKRVCEILHEQEGTIPVLTKQSWETIQIHARSVVGTL